MPVTATGSISFLGAATFKGRWNPRHNDATSSMSSQVYRAIFPTGTAGDGGYGRGVNPAITASQGDYWQLSIDGTDIEFSSTDMVISGVSDWKANDWLIYSGSGWMRLDHQDTVASVILGDLSKAGFHVGDHEYDTDVVFGKISGTTSVLTGSSKFQYNYTDSTLYLSGALNVSGNTTLGNAASNVLTTTGQLTASEGIAAAKKSYFSSSVQLGVTDSDVINITAQLTAAHGARFGPGPFTSAGNALFNSNVNLGNGASDVITVGGQLTASHGALVSDDKRVFFGDSEESSIRYDEAGDDFLVISGSASGVGISGSAVRVDGVLQQLGAAHFSSSMTLGVIDSDVITANSQLTASEGIETLKKARLLANNQLGNNDGFVTTIASQLTASSGASIQGSPILFGGSASDIVYTFAQVTASGAGLNVPDNKKLSFGSGDAEAHIKWDNTDEQLLISGSGIAVSSSWVTLPNIKAATIEDDVSLNFGSNASGSIKYSTSSNLLEISGTQGEDGTPGGIALSGSITSVSGKLTFDARPGGVGNMTGSFIKGAVGSTGRNTLQVSASEGIDILGHKLMMANQSRIEFGSLSALGAQPATIGLENNSNYLVISGTKAGISLSGSVVNIATNKADANYPSLLTFGHEQGYVGFGTNPGNMMYGNADGSQINISASSMIGVYGRQMRFTDDTRLAFGSAGESYIKYDEGGDDFLVISGSASGVGISGSVVRVDGALEAITGLSVSGGSLSVVGTISASSDLTVGGDLLVNGNTVTQDVTNLIIEDAVIGLGYGTTGSVTGYTDAATGSAGDRGLLMGLSGSNAVAMIWDNSETQFAFCTTANNPEDTAISPATYEDLRVSAIDIGGSVLLDGDGATKVQHDVTGALGGLRHDAGKLFVDIKNLPSGSDMAITDLMVFQDGHASGSTRVLPIQKLSNLLTGGAGDIAAASSNTFTGTNIFNGRLTGSHGLLIKDDKRLFFGDSEESSIKYDEAGDDFLIISGSNAGGVGISGSLVRVDANIEPTADSTYNLGSATRRFANIYTGDLHLRNEKGDWTIVEEADYLCVINNRSGKKYEMMLKEIE